ncbi:MAG: acylphosphatase [Planctomycetota bacterium]
MPRETIHFTGRVQGVGFRYTTQRLAQRDPRLAGTVENLPDGRVRLVIEGPGDAIDQLIDDLHQAFLHHIKHTDRHPAPNQTPLQGFHILR